MANLLLQLRFIKTYRYNDTSKCDVIPQQYCILPGLQLSPPAVSVDASLIDAWRLIQNPRGLLITGRIVKFNLQDGVTLERRLSLDGCKPRIRRDIVHP